MSALLSLPILSDKAHLGTPMPSSDILVERLILNRKKLELVIETKQNTYIETSVKQLGGDEDCHKHKRDCEDQVGHETCPFLI